MYVDKRTNERTNTSLMAVFSGLPGWASTRKVKPIRILLKQDSEWQWHQLGHMQVCISLQTANHASTPTSLCWQENVMRCWWQLCRTFNCRILYDHYLPTVILIIIGILSPTHSLTLCLNPFLQILPTAAFPFSPSGFTIWISHTVYCYFSAYPSFYFLVFFCFYTF